MKNSKLIWQAAADSLGVLAYICLVSLVLTNGAKIFGQSDNKIISPIIFLLLFVLSALITSSLILGKPILLYLEGLKKEGVKLLIYTIINLSILLLILFAILIIIR